VDESSREASSQLLRCSESKLGVGSIRGVGHGAVGARLNAIKAIITDGPPVPQNRRRAPPRAAIQRAKSAKTDRS